jgi:hypothetical protein
MEQQPKPLAWLIKTAVAAALLLLACGIATARFGHSSQLPVTTTRDGALVTMNRYVDNPVPDIVLVGSSLTFRLREEYFETSQVRNLAFAGGSPVTALEILASQRQLPKLIAVEINILSRAPDAELVKRFSTREGHEAMFFRPIRTAVAAYENRMHAPVTHAQIAARLKSLLAEPPSNFDNHVYLNRAIGEMESEDPSVATKVNIEMIGRLIEVLEKRGARVLLMELPYAPPIETSLYVRITRALVHRAFPEQSRWLPIDVDRNELRWDDGVHLDARSAVMVSRYLDERFQQIGN